MKIEVVAKAYYRAVKRGSRALDSVPDSIRPYVEKLLEEDNNDTALKGE